MREMTMMAASPSYHLLSLALVGPRETSRYLSLLWQPPMKMVPSTLRLNDLG
jgi:hypothetical protein